MHAVVPGLPLAAAFALGAIVAPPDAVAAIAIGRRAGMPTRLQTVIEGEGLLNDASALTIYAVAVAATTGGGFSFLKAGGQFLLESVGGLAVGLAVAWLIGRVRGRLEAPLVENALSLATPFLAYLPARAVHGSGVLAVVVCGLVLGHRITTLLSGVSRLQTQPVWRLGTFLLEGGVFALIGLQLPEILRGLEVYPVGKLVVWSLVLLAVVLLLRPVWIFPLTYLPRRLSLRLRERDPAPDFRIPLALSWAGPSPSGTSCCSSPSSSSSPPCWCRASRWARCYAGSACDAIARPPCSPRRRRSRPPSRWRCGPWMPPPPSSTRRTGWSRGCGRWRRTAATPAGSG